MHTDDEYRDTARRQCRALLADADALDIASYAPVQRVDGGAYVEAILWVPDAQVAREADDGKDSDYVQT